MKSIGWFCLILGGVALLGAIVKGHSAFGPLFWIALGAFLLYRADEKKSAQQTKLHLVKGTSDNTKQTGQPNVNPYIPVFTTPLAEGHSNSVSSKPAPEQSFHEPDSIEELQATMTLRQREAAMCLVAFFGGFHDINNLDVMTGLSKQAALFFGIPFISSEMSSILSKYTSIDKVIEILSTIKSRKAKEFLLLTCSDIANLSNKHEPHVILSGIAKDLGYNEPEFSLMIRKYQSLSTL